MQTAPERGAVAKLNSERQLSNRHPLNSHSDPAASSPKAFASPRYGKIRADLSLASVAVQALRRSRIIRRAG